jgi:hypothetical protein
MRGVQKTPPLPIGRSAIIQYGNVRVGIAVGVGLMVGLREGALERGEDGPKPVEHVILPAKDLWVRHGHTEGRTIISYYHHISLFVVAVELTTSRIYGADIIQEVIDAELGARHPQSAHRSPRRSKYENGVLLEGSLHTEHHFVPSLLTSARLILL